MCLDRAQLCNPECLFLSGSRALIPSAESPVADPSSRQNRSAHKHISRSAHVADTDLSCFLMCFLCQFQHFPVLVILIVNLTQLWAAGWVSQGSNNPFSEREHRTFCIPDIYITISVTKLQLSKDKTFMVGDHHNTYERVVALGWLRTTVLESPWKRGSVSCLGQVGCGELFWVLIDARRVFQPIPRAPNHFIKLLQPSFS